ncbi:hypothetical protein [Pseudomonas fluorescens]|uniref:Uncharacterized protein n=1 Tax=Pseudomonas fluorescens TaxID=294 RepID=A0A5E7EZ60_PSEFL|nr:hypothetical protein [Pseudomonas fluorescens]VVO32116.1 hypothetical protein PS691_05026 [Pseudomonas fluorescens]
MTSISGTVTAPLPVSFSLDLYGTAARRFDKELATQRKDERAQQIAAKRKAQHEVDLLAIEYAKEMLLGMVHDARYSLDEGTRYKCRKYVIDRVKVQEDEDDDKKKGAGAMDLIEVLAAISTAAAIIERTPPPEARIERDISVVSDNDFEKLMDDINNDEEDSQ